MTARILLIDDDRTTIEAIGPILTREGYEVDHTPTGRLALRQVLTDSPDLVVLGINSKKQDGDWRFCHLLLAFLESPLLLLLSTEDRLDRVKGLEVGADDCMVKPVLMVELVARVRALLRRNASEYSRRRQSLYVDGDLVVDLTRREVHLDDEPMVLTPIEFRILVCLIRQVEHVATYEHLRMQVWGPQRKGAQHSLKQHIHNLRQKLEPDPEHPQRIVTRWGQGYLLQRIAAE